MWKIVGYVMLWGVGSTAAVAVAWTGVSTVDDGIAPSAETSGAAALGSQTTDEPGSPAEARSDVAPSTDLTVETSASDNAGSIEDRSSGALAAGEQRVDESTASSTPRNNTSPPGPGQTTLRSTTSSTSAATSPDPTTSTSIRASSATTSTTVRPTTSTTIRSTTSSTAPATTNPSTTTTTVSATTKTFQLVGGTTAISFSASEVRVLWATPNPGFEVRVEPDRVEFRADHHESRIDVWWSDGPQHDIRERDR